MLENENLKRDLTRNFHFLIFQNERLTLRFSEIGIFTFQGLEYEKNLTVKLTLYTSRGIRVSLYQSFISTDIGVVSKTCLVLYVFL